MKARVLHARRGPNHTPTQLMETLRRRHQWIIADDEHRELARERFLNALHSLLALVEHQHTFHGVERD